MEIIQRTETSPLTKDIMSMIYDKRVTPEPKASFSLDNA